MNAKRYRRRLRDGTAEIWFDKRGMPHGKVTKRVTPTTTVEARVGAPEGARLGVRQEIGGHTVRLDHDFLTKTSTIRISRPRRSKRRR